MSNKRRMIGVVRPLEKIPCFGIPVFSVGRDLFLQVIGSDDIIVDFTGADVPLSIIQPWPSNLMRTIGSEAVYSFISSKEGMKVGSRKSISRFLLSRRSDFEMYPFLLTDIATFVGDNALLDKAIKNGAELLSLAGIPAAQEWHTPVEVRTQSISNRVIRSEGAAQLLKKDGLMQLILSAFLQGTGSDVEVTPTVVAAITDRYYDWIDKPKRNEFAVGRSPLDVWSTIGPDCLSRFREIGRRCAQGIHGSVLDANAFLYSALSVERESDCAWCPYTA